MNKEEVKVPRQPSFVKYCTGLSYLFDPRETRFLLHMIDIDYMKSKGFLTDWSRSEYMKRMGLNKNAFNYCVKRMQEMKLLIKWNNSLGNKVFYALNRENYERLIRILSCTNNIDALISFCQNTFQSGRSIESITEEEIQKLESTRMRLPKM